MAICVDIVPTPCGGTNKLTMKDVCNEVYFTGIEDTTINQGVGIDLTEGIHAYDGNGNEIEYTVTPDSIDKCDVGEHTVVYRTIGEGDKFLPSFCMDNVDVTLGDTFCNEILLEEDRIVTITQADPPTIEGLETIPTIYPNEEFDPTEGITATDDNGKTIDFTYSGRVEDSSEGAIASFETEFEQNALSVVADIEPIQDLHGYDKPWSGGAGKNKWDFAHPQSTHYASVSENADGTFYVEGGRAGALLYYLVPVTANQTYTIKISSTGDSGNVSILGYSTVYDGSDTSATKLLDNVSTKTEKTFTPTGSVVYIVFKVTGGNGAGSANVVDPMIEAGSTRTAYEPYSNICPISGRTEVVTWDDPKHGGTVVWNQLVQNGIFASTSNWQAINGSLSVSNNVATVTATGDAYIRQDELGIPANHVCLFTGELTVNGSERIVNYQGYTQGWASCLNITSSSSAAIAKPSATLTRLFCAVANHVASGDTLKYKNIQIFDLTQMFGSTIADEIYAMEQTTVGSGVAWFKNLFPKDYYAYNTGETTCVSAVNGDEYHQYTTDLGRTVYGGTLDVVSGVLTVDMGIVDLGTITPSMATVTQGNLFRFAVSGIKAGGYVETVPNIICEAFPTTSNQNRANYTLSQPTGQQVVDIIDNDYSDANTFKTAMSGIHIAYELATPTTYQLTPTEVQTLLGQNNIWADTGDIKVIYEKEMPASGNIEYLTAGFKIITYTATDECGNQTVEQRIIYVLGDTPQVCMAEVCTAHTACVVSKICSSEICTAQCS